MKIKANDPASIKYVNSTRIEKAKMINPASIEYDNPARLENVELICHAVKNGGRTLKKLQKMIYFTQYTGHKVGHYELGYHGVISHWTANILGVAVDLGVISRRREHNMWIYDITKDGNKFLKRMSDNTFNTENTYDTDNTKSLFAYTGKMDPLYGMLAASIDYLQKNNTGIKMGEIEKKLSYTTRSTGGFDEALIKLENIKSIIKTGELLPHKWKYHAGDNKFAVCNACRLIKHELKTETCYFHPNGSEIIIKKGNESSLPICEHVRDYKK